MATNVFVVRDGTLKLGPTGTSLAVECQCSVMVLNPSTDMKEITTACGRVQVPGITAWTLHVEGAQDWTATTGVSDYLNDNDGELIDFELVPFDTTTPKATGKAYGAPGAFGGTAGEIAVFSVDLGVNGKPVFA